MKIDKHLVLDRIYVDTNVLISATLESDLKWQEEHCSEAKNKEVQIATSREIFAKWDTQNLRLSPYTLGEFISKGKKRFNKTHEEMLALVSEIMGKKCTLLQSTITERQVPTLSKDYDDNLWQLANINLEGEIEDESTKSLSKGSVRIIVNTSGMVSTSWGGFGSTIDNPKIKILSKVEYSAPAYEMMLFSKAAEMSLKYDINLSDAIHLVYAKDDEIDIIVSNDADFETWNKVPKELTGRIKVMTSEQVLAQNKQHLDS